MTWEQTAERGGARRAAGGLALHPYGGGEVPSIGVKTASGGGLLIAGVDLLNDANSILVLGPLGDFGQ